MPRKAIHVCAFALLLLLNCAVRAAVPDVILDCDIGTDIDDMSDIAILHALADRGELNLIATAFCMSHSYGPGMLEAVNRYYGRPEIPVAAASGSFVATPDRYGSLIFTNYYNLVGNGTNAPDAVSLYRKILNERPDHSVTFLFTGMMVNLAKLWHSGPDAFSPLTGQALMESKVKRIYIVAGYLPVGGPEYNLFYDADAAQVLNEIRTVPVTWAGTELGWLLPIGSRIADKPEIDPVRLAHLEFYRITSNVWFPSWSGVAMLDMARPNDTNGAPIYNRVKGWAAIDPRGANSWITNDNGSQEYLVFARATPTQYQADLDTLLMQPPLHAPTNPPFAPFVRMDGQIIATPPFVRPTQSTIALENRLPGGGPIYFKLDGSAPSKASTQFADPFILHTNATLRAVAYNNDLSQSAEIGPLSLEIRPVVSLKVVSAHGAVTAMPPPINGSYLSNQVVELFPLGAKGWKFLRWTNNPSGADTPLRLTMDGDKVIQAIFEPDAAAAQFSANLSGNKIELRFEGAEGALMTILSSSDLRNWSSIHSEMLSTGPATFTEPVNLEAPRYYRVSQQ